MSFSQNEDNCWKPTVCMNFCCDFLSFVKCIATEDSHRWVVTNCSSHIFTPPPSSNKHTLKSLLIKCFHFSVVYLFSWEPRRDVTYSVHRDSQYSFLPRWYIEEMTSSQDSHHQHQFKTWTPAIWGVWKYWHVMRTFSVTVNKNSLFFFCYSS